MEDGRIPDELITPRTLARWYLLKRLERHLLRTGSPRLQMLMLVSATGSVGLLTSIALLRMHVQNMALRYIICVAVAYGAFLVLVSLWLLYQRRRWDRFARAGRPATGDFAVIEKVPVARDPSKWMDWVDPGDDIEAGLFVLALIVIIIGTISVVFMVWYVISIVAFAPEFLAEVFLDGVFSVALYNRLRRIEHHHWLKSVFARTYAPFLWTFAFFTFVGVVSHHYAPEAVSIGGFVRHIIKHAL